MKKNPISLSGEKPVSVQECPDDLRALQKLLESSLDVICSIDADGRFIYVSQAAAQVWGYRPQELQGRRHMDMVVEEDHLKTAAVAEAIIAGKEITSFENRYRRKDGTIVPMHWSARWSEEEKIMFCVARDVTQIKKTETQSKVQERRLKRAYSLAEIAWWEYDVASKTYTCSDEIFEMYGLSVPENRQLSLEAFLSCVHPDDRQRLEHDLSVIFQNTYCNYEHRVVKSSGAIIYVIHFSEVTRDREGNPVTIHGTTKDISKRKLQQLRLEASEKALQEHSKKLAEILESIGDGFFTVDKNWTVTHWNRKAEELLGKKKEEMIGSNLWQEFKEAVPLKFYKEYHRAMAENTAIQFEDFYAPLNMWIEVSGYPSAEALSVYFKDITGKKAQEQALKLANERFELAAKATHQVLWDWDLTSNACYFNANFSKLFGYTNAADLIYNNRIDNIHEADKERVLALLEASLNDHAVHQFEVEYRFYRKDRTIAFVLDTGFIIRNSHGKAVRIVGSMQDISALKEAENVVARSERRFKAMVQSGKDLIMLLNSSFECIYTSPNYLEATGFTPEELKGFLTHDRIHPEDFQPLLDAAQHIFAQSSVTLPLFRFKNKNGEYRWYESVLSNHLNNPDIEAIVANVRDVTARVAADEELKRLALVAKETINAVVISDAEEKITWVNKAFSDITGYSFEEVLGKKPGELLQGEKTSERTRKYIRNCVKHKRPFDCEIINYTKAGKPYWMEIKGQPIFDEKGNLKQFFAIQTDITVRKEAEAAIKTSEERYKRLFYNTFQPKWIFHSETQKIMEVNDAACALYGYSREDFLQLCVQALRRPEDDAELRAAFQALKTEKKGFLNQVIVHRKKSGKEFYTEISAFPVELPTGLHFIVSGIDMTEKLHLQQQLIAEKVSAQKAVARAMIHAQEAERSKIGKELHDNVCQLLTTSKLYIENIRHFPEQQEQFTAKGVELLLQSINEIRYLSRQLVSPVLNDISFEASVNDLIHHYRAVNLFEICFHYEAATECIDNDLKLSIIRILQEQFNNTVKYAKASLVQVTIRTAGDTLLLRYADNGVGFDTGKASTGIGLTNIGNRAGAFRGDMKLTSAPGRGVQIDITFPLSEKAELTGLSWYSHHA